MNSDSRIQELFDDFRPMLSDSDLFNQRLERKLALIDEMRQAQSAQIHRARMAVVVAFVAGIVFGGMALFLILSVPSDAPLFTFGIKAFPFLFIEQNSWLISALLASLMIAGCIAAALNTADLLRRLKVGKA